MVLEDEGAAEVWNHRTHSLLAKVSPFQYFGILVVMIPPAFSNLLLLIWIFQALVSDMACSKKTESFFRKGLEEIKRMRSDELKLRARAAYFEAEAEEAIHYKAEVE